MKNKVRKNDEGQVVPEKCDKCGGDVVLQIHGEPVYLCKKCGKYFGTMPCNLKENKIMKNNVVKINENTLRQIVAESVKKVLSEEEYSEDQINRYKKAYNLIEQIEECLSSCHIQNIGKRYNQARDTMIGKNLSNAKKYLRDIIKSKEMQVF